MDKFKITDATGNEAEVDQNAFALCQENVAIHDEEFKSKPTTFAKDAFKRFCKNKSSVVAAIIIGILMVLSLLVPLVSRYDLSTPHLDQAFLPPRITNSGSGFWDGTKKYTDIIYDPKTEAPAGYNKDAVVKIISHREELLDNANEYAFGGIYVFEASKGKKSENGYQFDYFKHANAIDFTNTNDISVHVKMNSEDFDSSKYLVGEYRIVLQGQSTEDYVVLRDWTTEVSDFDYNISEYLANNSKTSLKGYIRFDVKYSAVLTPYPTIFLNSIEYTTTLEGEENQALIDKLETVSITDPNATKTLGTKDLGYWHSTGSTNVIKTQVSYMTFLYDEYAAKLGYIKDYEIGKRLMTEYINKGWCQYDFTVGPESFVKLSEKCPIERVTDQKSTTINDNEVTNLVCEVYKYKILGYSSMPKFLFGTDSSGFDLFTRAFASLRTSLVVAIIISAVCFAFGLCWGAISGYFGGNVDLLMERFCEILGGMPWIVMMTLAIILWGNTLGTFAIATCITGWMGTAATTRTQFYRFKGREYILSSRTLGSSDMRLIFKHILPNALGTIVTASVLKIPGVIFSEATLSYLGLGLKGVNSFGTMLSDNQQYLGSYPVLILLPAVIISLLMISFNLFGNGLRDALNPSLKGSE